MADPPALFPVTQNPHVPADGFSPRDLYSVSCTYFITEAGRQPRRAGPTCSPGSACSHGNGHTTCTVMNPLPLRVFRNARPCLAACSSVGAFGPRAVALILASCDQSLLPPPPLKNMRRPRGEPVGWPMSRM